MYREKAIPSNKADGSSKVSKKNTREIEVLDLPGFPKYIITGDTKADEKNYQAAKAKWMDENPEVYKESVDKHTGNSGNKLNRKKPEASK